LHGATSGKDPQRDRSRAAAPKKKARTNAVSLRDAATSRNEHLADLT